ncbi:MAG: hypothetical protein NTU93_06845 [Arthrobacter sp.]|nr:hypothetical protein [Arthrobacter sp.]
MARSGNRHSDEQPLRRVAPDERWQNLRQGDRVRVRLAPGHEAGGFVDALTTDHTTVWVALDGGGRTLLHCSDGVEILPHGA